WARSSGPISAIASEDDGASGDSDSASRGGPARAALRALARTRSSMLRSSCGAVPVFPGLALPDWAAFLPFAAGVSPLPLRGIDGCSLILASRDSKPARTFVRSHHGI